MRILLIEDDEETAVYIAQGLREAGHVTDHAATGPAGLEAALSGAHDVIILDRMLPHMDGLSLVRTLREAGRSTPTLILSALSQVDDRVKGLKAGGDDYLTKPFAFSELEARLDALARRAPTSPEAETHLSLADLEMDLLAREVRRAGQRLDLQPREFQILEYLLRRQGRVVTRTMLLEGVWDYSFDPQTNVIDVHISRLRQKVDKGFEPPLLHTIRGAGYALRLPEGAA